VFASGSREALRRNAVTLVGVRRYRRFLVPLLIVVAVLAPYWRLATMRAVLVTDDGFVSDVFNGELARRAWLGSAWRSGEAAVWIREIGMGIPAVQTDWIALLLSAAFPPVWALNLQILEILAVAALGTYAYARQTTMSRAASAFSAISFGWSGFMVCQLKHVAEVQTVAWFPWGLFFLERAFAPMTDTSPRWAARTLSLAGFGGVVGAQLLADFPQCAYYSFLVYAGYAVARASVGITYPERRQRAAKLVFVAAGMAILGIGMGAHLIVGLSEVTAASQRSSGVGSEVIVETSYRFRSALNFFVPFIDGDVSNGTYSGKLSLFWEQYGYAGGLTAVLGLGAAVLGLRDRRARAWLAIMLFGFVLMAGFRVPGLRVVLDYVPGLPYFRYPSRALFLVTFALVLLAGSAVDMLARRLGRTTAASRWPWVIACVPWLCVAVTYSDLMIHQRRQNAFGPVEVFARRPKTAEVLAERLHGRRYFSVDHRKAHLRAHREAHGWANLAPYARMLELLEPNSNLLWGVSSADGYAPLPLRYMTELWGSHTRRGLLDGFTVGSPAWMRIMVLGSVSHLVSETPIASAEARLVQSEPAFVYEIPATLTRAYVATRVQSTTSASDAFAKLMSTTFEPGRDVLLADDGVPLSGPLFAPPLDVAQPTAHIVDDRDRHVAIEVDAPAGGVLVLTDAYFAPWEVTIDGLPGTIRRANHIHRGVELTPGRHLVQFDLQWNSIRLAFLASVACACALVIAACAAAIVIARGRRRLLDGAEPNQSDATGPSAAS
jgi:hypothetical protein